MKRKKLTFMNVKEQELTRDEMRNVMAGCGGSGGDGECDLYCGSGHIAACGVEPCLVSNGKLLCAGRVYKCSDIDW
jgi:hypothetical protein